MKGWTSQSLPGLSIPQSATSRLLDEHEQATAIRSNWKNDGRGFQKEIEQTAGAYQSRRIARLQKVDPPVAVIWPTDPKTGQKSQRVIFKHNPWLDFAGVWTAHHGRALMIECKSTATHRLGLRDGQLGPDQMAAIKTWRLAGAAAAVVWRFNDRCCLFTPEMLMEAEARGDKSLVFESGLPVERGPGTVIWDFLATLERAIWPPKPEPNRIELTYRGLTIYFGRAGWSCDAVPGCFGLPTIERALEAIDAQRPRSEKLHVEQSEKGT